MAIPESDIKIRIDNFYSWKNYHAGWDINVQDKNKKVRVKTTTTDTMWVVATKINKALKEKDGEH